MAEDTEMPDASEHSAYGSYDNNNNVDPMELGEEDEIEEVDGISSQMQSIFFSLPLEIRQKIYSELLSRHKNRERTPNRNWEITQQAECDCWENGAWDCGRHLQVLISGNHNRTNRAPRLPPAWTVRYRLNVQILRTCIRIYEEAREFLYERNQWIDVSFCSNALRQVICLLGIRPVTRHTRIFKQPNKFASTVFKLHICPFNTRCRQSLFSMRTVFLVGPEDLSDIVPSISNCVRNGIEPFSTMNMRFYPDHIWPRGAGRSLVEFQRKVLGILSRIRMTSRPMVGWPLPGPNEWAVHPLEQIAKTKVEKRFAPRLTTFMPVHAFLAYFLKRMKCYVTHRWDPRWEAEEDNVRDLAFQWYNGFLRYRQQILEIPRYQRRARTISVQLQLRFQIVQLHRGTYCYHTNALELSLNEGELKGNKPTIQRYWTGAQWCLGDMDLEPSSKEYQLILNIGWLFTWNHIPSWWDSLWEYVNSENFDRNRARRFLSKHVPRIAKIGDYGSSRGCRDPEGLSKEVENALSQFYIDSEPSDPQAEEEL